MILLDGLSGDILTRIYVLIFLYILAYGKILLSNFSRKHKASV